jgi:CheY-like chemotaxis protein
MEKQRILIIDDEKTFTEMLKLNLESMDEFDVRIENNPTRAVTSALQFNPHLVLLDVMMPGLEGPDVANQFKNNEHLRKIPIVYLTSTIREEEVDQNKGEIGGHPFVAKPTDIETLIVTIKRNL